MWPGRYRCLFIFRNLTRTIFSLIVTRNKGEHIKLGIWTPWRMKSGSKCVALVRPILPTFRLQAFCSPLLFSPPFPPTSPKWSYLEIKILHTSCHLGVTPESTYIPRMSVPSFELGLPPSHPSDCAPTPNQRWRAHTRLRVRRWGSPNLDDWRKISALCLLKENILQYVVYNEIFPPLKRYLLMNSTSVISPSHSTSPPSPLQCM